MSARALSLSICAAAAALAGCAVSPPYKAPDLAVPAQFSVPSETLLRPQTPWLDDDPELSALLNRMLAQNLDIQRAAARIDQARAQTRIAGAAAGPSVSAKAQASETKLSKNSSLASIAAGAFKPGGGAAGLPGTEIKSFQLGFDAAWELDLFGANASTVAAARARDDAAELGKQDVQVTLWAEVMRGYWRYRSLQQRLALIDQQRAARSDRLDYDRVRAANGIVTVLDPDKSQGELATLDAERQTLIAQRDAQAHALAVLTGQSPLALEHELASPAPARDPDLALPPGLPADLLRRRPDVRLAERNLAAATEDSRAAIAGLYPKISLTGAADLVSSALKTLLASDSFQPSAALAVSLPLLDSGRRHGQVDLKKAQVQEALLAYRAAVLTALREVEDSLSRRQADREAIARLTAGRDAARDAEDAMAARVQNGLNPQTDALDTRIARLRAEDALVQAKATAFEDEAAQFKAMGGGWTQTPGTAS